MLAYPDMELARHIVRDRLGLGHGQRRVGRRRFLPERSAGHSPRPAPPVSIEVRVACPADAPRLDRVAALDEQPPLAGDRLLVAEVGRAIWAALDLDSDRSVADPFVPSADAVELLRLRARQLRDAGARPRRRAHATPGRASATVGV